MGSASYTKGAKRVGGNHEWVGMNHEIHEWREGEIHSHEWTRMGTNGKFRTANGHEWTRKGNSEPRMDTNRWEEPRMDTNGTTKYRSGTTKHTKNTKKGRGDSMNHERHERIV